MLKFNGLQIILSTQDVDSHSYTPTAQAHINDIILQGKPTYKCLILSGKCGSSTNDQCLNRFVVFYSYILKCVTIYHWADKWLQDEYHSMHTKLLIISSTNKLPQTLYDCLSSRTPAFSAIIAYYSPIAHYQFKLLALH